MNYKIELTQSELYHMVDFTLESPKGFSVDIEFTEGSNCVNTKFHKMTWVHINYDQCGKIAFESDILSTGFFHKINDINKICIYEN